MSLRIFVCLRRVFKGPKSNLVEHQSCLSDPDWVDGRCVRVVASRRPVKRSGDGIKGIDLRPKKRRDRWLEGQPQEQRRKGDESALKERSKLTRRKSSISALGTPMKATTVSQSSEVIYRGALGSGASKNQEVRESKDPSGFAKLTSGTLPVEREPAK